MFAEDFLKTAGRVDKTVAQISRAELSIDVNEEPGDKLEP